MRLDMRVVLDELRCPLCLGRLIVPDARLTPISGQLPDPDDIETVPYITEKTNALSARSVARSIHCERVELVPFADLAEFDLDWCWRRLFYVFSMRKRGLTCPRVRYFT